MVKESINCTACVVPSDRSAVYSTQYSITPALPHSSVPVFYRNAGTKEYKFVLEREIVERKIVEREK